MNKGFAPIYILISLAIIITAAGAYYIQKTTVPTKTVQPVVVSQPTPTPKTQVDETTDWKTYEDQENGFSFKYPNNWNIDNSYRSADDPIRFFKVGDKPSYTYMMGKGNEQLIIAVQTDRSFDEIQKQLNIKDASLMIAGKKSLKYITGAYILLGPSDKRILSVFMPQYPNDGYLDQILSTFKFTN